MELTLWEAAKACNGQLCHGAKVWSQENIEDAKAQEWAGVKLTQVVIDSRKVIKGGLFIATKGERVDGHSFIPQVAEKGAAGVVCEVAPQNCEVPYILVKDSFVALKQIAEYYRLEHLKHLKVVGITGSVGKTSTKEFVASVLAVKYKVLKTEGNYNNEVGLPLTVLSIRKEHEVAVLEMGISEFGEMHRLSKAARPDYCLITNIGQCHLENLKSRDGILKAKTEIFDYMKEDGTVCLNGDDDKLITVDKVKGKEPILFSKSNEKMKVYASHIKSRGLFGSFCRICTPIGEFETQVPLPGEHMVQNACAATCMGLELGLTLEEIDEGIRKVPAVNGRSNIIRLKDYTLIDDCYNANPVSMRSAIDLLKTADTRTVAVLGDMFELGEDEVNMHAGIGAYAVENKVDVLICVGNLSKHMYEAAIRIIQAKGQEAGNEEITTKCYYFATREELLTGYKELIQSGDTILIKASHGMGFAAVVEDLS
ncbi:MAG: UDP-N-acetylmuramoyl-tripeptide--D-alanyl-D-alanine ligase [Lachnospiraceae bacterium]|nr:UDP-N-acetylmuramoyl-tripeptide--D-alanyl-D-alanine ligase [Lachnospiraceae bacterium]